MTESAYIENLKSNNREGFVAIYNKFYTPILYFITRYVKSAELAEEVLADVFVAVWNRRMEFETYDGLRAFLYVAAKNASLNTIRSNKKYSLLEPISDFEHVLITDKDAFSQMVHVELIQSIFEDVNRLPVKQRDVFNLTYLEDKTVEEISELLNMSATAVYANRSRAIQTLRLSLKAKNHVFLLAFSVLIGQ